jgi:hypothetical protein
MICQRPQRLGTVRKDPSAKPMAWQTKRIAHPSTLVAQNPTIRPFFQDLQHATGPHYPSFLPRSTTCDWTPSTPNLPIIYFHSTRLEKPAAFSHPSSSPAPQSPPPSAFNHDLKTPKIPLNTLTPTPSDTRKTQQSGPMGSQCADKVNAMSSARNHALLPYDSSLTGPLVRRLTMQLFQEDSNKE